MLINAEDLAYGHWPEILSAAGVDSAYLTGRNGPCPFCPDGGTDRYQFQNKGGGRYVCRHCTNGAYRSGFDFLMRHLGLRTFREAADYVRRYYNVDAASGHSDEELQVIARKAKTAASRDAMTPEKAAYRVGKMERLISQGRPVRPGDPVDLYLRSRFPRLRTVPAKILFHPELEYWDAPKTMGDRPTLRGTYPGMLIPGYDSGGSLVQVHKTFLTHAGEKADVPSVRKVDVGIGCNAFALELEEPTGDTLGVCEGVETAIGAMLFRPQVPVWPCYSAGVLANFTLPERLRGQVRKLVIYEDNDHCKNGLRAGQIAGSKLADRCRAQGLKYMIVRPAKTGDDMANHASRL